MPQPLLSGSVNVLLKRRETDNPVGRFDGNTHFIPVIRSSEVQAVGSRPDCSAQDQPTLCYLGGSGWHARKYRSRPERGAAAGTRSESGFRGPFQNHPLKALREILYACWTNPPVHRPLLHVSFWVDCLLVVSVDSPHLSAG